VAAGIIDGDFTAFSEPMTRLGVFLLTARGFGFAPTEIKESALAGFSDTSDLSGADRAVVAGLAERGLVKGYNGSLHLSEPVTRAEFLVFLYRMADFSEESWEAWKAERAALAETEASEDERVLALINSHYSGDYTQAWAEAHDYTVEEKERWIRLRGYDSSTDYLLWVSITHQRVNVFTREAGNWRLEKCFLAGTGAPGYGTPQGMEDYLKTRGGTLPPTREPRRGIQGRRYGSSGFVTPAQTISDPSIGFRSATAVCGVKEDIDWLFDTIPVETTCCVLGCLLFPANGVPTAYRKDDRHYGQEKQGKLLLDIADAGSAFPPACAVCKAPSSFERRDLVHGYNGAPAAEQCSDLGSARGQLRIPSANAMSCAAASTRRPTPSYPRAPR
jgi:hypothetical protein